MVRQMMSGAAAVLAIVLTIAAPVATTAGAGAISLFQVLANGCHVAEYRGIWEETS
jgi:hypothetical protein